MHLRFILPYLFALLLGIPYANGQGISYNNPPINYDSARVRNPVASLERRLQQGRADLHYEPRLGYLRSLLAELDVPESSQTLVFTKTSLQQQRISPARPRAIYFSDSVYVGWCQQGEVIELSVADRRQGAIFYTLNQDSAGPPRIVRDQGNCLTCHANSRTFDIPGHLVRSVYSDRVGLPLLSRGSFVTDHTSSFDKRWGGWYVTGTHGHMRHMGNAILSDEQDALDRDRGANKQSLKGIVSTAPYLTPHSDIVALMVLEHQTLMHNMLAAANYKTRQILYQAESMNDMLGREAGYLSESGRRRIHRAAESVLECLLFCEEFMLEAPVRGTSSFAQEFSSLGIKDEQGRSLRQFDLERRLFKYPCSYLIYSPAFDGLPREVREIVIARLQEVLSNKDNSAKFQHLSREDRQAIRQILKETKHGFSNL